MDNFDYLYVDQNRVDFYFDQLGHGHHIENVFLDPGEYRISETSLPSSPAYTPSLLAKAEFVLNHLTQNRFVASAFSYSDLQPQFDHNNLALLPYYVEPLDTRSHTLDSSLHRRHFFPRLPLTPFVHARLAAAKIVFPFTLAHSADPGITIWLHCSGAGGALTNIWICENLTASDVESRFPIACRYSAFVGIIKENSSDFLRTNLAAHQFVHDLQKMSFVDFQRTHSELLDRLMFVESAEVATQLGGQIAWPTREVEVFCRLREHAFSSSMGSHVYAQAVFVRVTSDSDTQHEGRDPNG